MNDIKNNALIGLNFSKNNILKASDNISKSFSNNQYSDNEKTNVSNKINILNTKEVDFDKNIDLAQETVDLIQASRHYEANLKVLGVWSNLLDDELNILK